MFRARALLQLTFVLLGDANVIHDAVVLRLVDDRAHVDALVQRIAHPQHRELPLELLDQNLLDVLLHEQARASAADLALVEPDGVDDGVDGGVEIGRVEDNDRRLAAELERHLNAQPGGLAPEQLANSGGAGEGDLIDARVVAEVAAHLAGSREDVDHAGRHAGLRHDLGEEDGRQGRVGGRLEHNAVAHRQSRSDLPREHEQGKVPRDDLPDDAKRRVARHLGLGELRPAGVVVEVANHEGDIGVASLADGLAIVHCLQHGDEPGVLLQAARDRIEVARAHVARRLGEALEGLARSGDGAVDVLVRALHRLA